MTLSRGEQVFAAFTGIAIATLVLTGALVWPVMLMFGVVHDYWAFLPAFSFWQTLGIVVLVRLLMPFSVRAT